MGAALSDLFFFPCYNTRKLDAFYFVVIFVLEVMTFNESSLIAPVYAKVRKKKDWWPTVMSALFDKAYSTD